MNLILENFSLEFIQINNMDNKVFRYIYYLLKNIHQMSTMLFVSIRLGKGLLNF